MRKTDQLLEELSGWLKQPKSIHYHGVNNWNLLECSLVSQLPNNSLLKPAYYIKIPGDLKVHPLQQVEK